MKTKGGENSCFFPSLVRLTLQQLLFVSCLVSHYCVFDSWTQDRYFVKIRLANITMLFLKICFLFEILSEISSLLNSFVNSQCCTSMHNETLTKFLIFLAINSLLTIVFSAL